MFLSFQTIVLSSLVLTVVVINCVTAAGNDPKSYFEGVDNYPYLSWLRTASYEKSTFLQKQGSAVDGAALHWTLDRNRNHIKLAVAVKATGWVGFALPESGGLLGADVVLYDAATNELTDSYILYEPEKMIPDKIQNWKLIKSTVDDNFIIFEATRMLDTGDTQDRPLIDDSTPKITATAITVVWGDGYGPSYDGVDDRVEGLVRFFRQTAVTEDDLFHEGMVEAEGTFDLLAADYRVKSRTGTDHTHLYFSREELIEQGAPMDEEFHIIGYEPVIDLSENVHHIAVSAPEPDSARIANAQPIYAWQLGMPPTVFPPNTGFPFGGNGYSSFFVGIHYNIPSHTQGLIDNSGIRVYYTTKKREFDLGVPFLGDRQVHLKGESVGGIDGVAEHKFTCSSRCTSSALDEPITIIREGMHMHKHGVSQKNVQRRNGEIIHEGHVQFYDFDQKGDVHQEPYIFKPGDTFETSCYYKTGSPLTFGGSTEEEMCMMLLLYYPKKELKCEYNDLKTPCSAKWEFNDNTELSYTGRVFGKEGQYEPKLLESNAQSKTIFGFSYVEIVIAFLLLSNSIVLTVYFARATRDNVHYEKVEINE